MWWAKIYLKSKLSIERKKSFALVLPPAISILLRLMLKSSHIYFSTNLPLATYFSSPQDKERRSLRKSYCDPMRHSFSRNLSVWSHLNYVFQSIASNTSSIPTLTLWVKIVSALVFPPAVSILLRLLIVRFPGRSGVGEERWRQRLPRNRRFFMESWCSS